MTADGKLKPRSTETTQISEVGYKRPPAHSRFKPGQSGNPSGRAKGSKNLKTLLDQILKEEVSLREGSEVRKVSKAEAILRSVVLGALKGDVRHQTTLFRLAEQTGQFDDTTAAITEIRRIIVTGVPRFGDDIPAITEINKEDE
jgi:hypothetical protein